MKKIAATSGINLNVVLVVGAAVGAYFYVLKPILEATGIKSTAEEEEAKRKDAELENKGIWDTQASLFKKYKKGTAFQLLKVADANIYATKINDAWGFFNDDEEQVYAQFRALRYQSQVSSIVDAYQRLFKKDLQTTLKANLSSSEFAQITKIISSKPSGISQ